MDTAADSLLLIQNHRFYPTLGLKSFKNSLGTGGVGTSKGYFKEVEPNLQQ